MTDSLSDTQLEKINQAITTMVDKFGKDKLSTDELKEILVQLYAYCGFPRSLNALKCVNEAAKQHISTNK